MKKSTIIILFGLVCLVLMAFIAMQYAGIAGLKKTMAARTRERDMAARLIKARENDIKNLNEQLTQAGDRLADLEKTAQEPVNTGQQTELDRWLGAIRQLKNFLKRHPEYAIPDLKYLINEDWLDETESAHLQSEADYRKALAALRAKAKLKTVGMVAGAVGGYSNASGGKFPQSIENIIPYLPQGFDSSIARRFTINTDEKAPGRFPIEWQIAETDSALVDDIWDGKAYLNKQKNGAAISGVDSSDSKENENVVRNAITQYENEHGAKPSDIDQITKYIDNGKIDKTKAGEIYKSIMTPIQ